MNILELEHSLVLTIKCGLVKLVDTQVFLLAIWLWHLEEGINFANSWYVIWNERLKFCIQVYLLWLVSLNVLKEIFHIVLNLQIRVISRVVSTWNLFIIICIVLLVVFILQA